MIPIKYAEMCGISIPHSSSTSEEFRIFYVDYLAFSDQRVLQHIREKALNLPQRLSDEEYLEFEQSRQFAVEQIRLLSSENE